MALKSLIKKGLVEATDTNYIPGDGRIRKSDAQRLNENPDLVSSVTSVCIKLTPTGVKLIEKMYSRKEMGSGTFEAVVVNRGPQPKGAVAKTMMNHAMMEKAKIEQMIHELENKVHLGIISEDQLMMQLEKSWEVFCMIY